MLSTIADKELNYLPRLPKNKNFRIGCIGSGFIMADCHLVAYEQVGFNPAPLGLKMHRETILRSIVVVSNRFHEW